MKNLSSQGQHYEGVTCYWLFLEIFLSGICVGRCPRTFIWTASDLDDCPRWAQGSGVVCQYIHEVKKKEMKGLGKVKEGDRREGGKTGIYQGSITKRSTQKLSLFSG